MAGEINRLFEGPWVQTPITKITTWCWGNHHHHGGDLVPAQNSDIFRQGHGVQFGKKIWGCQQWLFYFFILGNQTVMLTIPSPKQTAKAECLWSCMEDFFMSDSQRRVGQQALSAEALSFEDYCNRFGKAWRLSSELFVASSWLLLVAYPCVVIRYFWYFCWHGLKFMGIPTRRILWLLAARWKDGGFWSKCGFFLQRKYWSETLFVSPVSTDER